MKAKKAALLGVIGALCLVTLLTGCETTPAQSGALGGAVVGAAAGGLIGRSGKGALIGAGAGALGGALLNDHIDKQKREAYNQGYNQGAVTAPQSTTPTTAAPAQQQTPAQQTTIQTQNNYYNTAPR
ncbi:MAG: glycine zipper domain-containing protein [Candidatus Omnitrophota bacterium]